MSVSAHRFTITAAVSACVLLATLLSMAGPATALTHPERHYEMVSPPYKGGYGVGALEAVAVAGAGEGDRVEFESLGVFAGAPNAPLLNTYLAIRSTTGWSTTPQMLPVTPTAPRGNESSREVVSPSLESVLFVQALANHRVGEVQEGAQEGFFEKEYLFQPLPAPGTPPQIVWGPLTAIGGGAVGDIAAQGASPDLCHVVFHTAFPLLAEDNSGENQLYELSAGSSVSSCGTEAPSLRLLAVEAGPKGELRLINPYCEPILGGGEIGGRGDGNLNVISADGSEVFFTADPNIGPASCDGVNGYFPQGPAQLFVRLNGERTLEIAHPLAADCAVSEECNGAPPQRATFTGASEAGTRVFFTTIQPLVSGDAEFVCREAARVNGVVEGLGEFATRSGCETGTGEQKERGRWKRFGTDIYMAALECPGGGEACPPAVREVTSLTQISRSVIPGEAAEVQGEQAVLVSSSGERVYFVARGVLTQGATSEGRAPVRGADNLYVYDAAEGRNHFVADLCSGPEQSGEAGDPSCPRASEGEEFDTRLWLGERHAETTGDGQFLVFTSCGQLAPNDTDTAMDIYRYDAATEALERVSVGEDGFDQNGNNSSYNVELPNLTPAPKFKEGDYMNDRAISEDGSRIVFGTAEPLSSQALNGLANVYEWHEGHVSLISSGVAPEEEGNPLVSPPVITPSGRDIFFVSAQGLVPQDTDGVRDVYDARLGPEEFPQQPAARRACEGDACQGPLTNPAPLLVPGSASQAPGENVPAPKPVQRKKSEAKAKKRKPRSRRRRGRRKRSVLNGKGNRRRGR